MVDNQKSDSQDKKPDPIVPSEPIKPASNSNTNKPAGGNEPADQPKKPVWEKQLRGWLMVGFTGTLALYTAYLYSVAVRQTDIVKTYSDAAKVSAEAALRGVAVAESSIAISKSIAQNQERFARIETRAYLNLKSTSRFILKVGQPIDMVFEYINSGKTPAYQWKVATGYKTGTGLYKEQIQDIEMDLQRESKPMTVGPGQTIYVVMPKTIFKRTDSLYVADEKVKLLFYGRMEFVDVFGRQQWVNFCFECMPNLKTLEPYKTFNDASH